MQTLAINAIPSQTLSFIDPDENQWDIGIRAVASSIAFSFTLNGTLLIQNVCAVAGYRIIPYDYLESGNFVLVTQAQQVPDYTQFGVTQQLLFLAAADIAAFRVPLSSLVQVTAASFDPNGALPLRFAPQGYALA